MGDDKIRFGPGDPPAPFCTSMVWSQSVSIGYRVDPDAVAAVLPPVLRRPENPRVNLRISIDTVGEDTYASAYFGVQAMHGENIGLFPLLVATNRPGEAQILRDVWGLPAKQAEIILSRDNNDITATVTRGLTRVMHIRATVMSDLEIEEDKTLWFAFNGLRHPTSDTFVDDPVLIYVRTENDVRSKEKAMGFVRLGNSDSDPLGDLAVRGQQRIYASERFVTTSAELRTRVDRRGLVPLLHRRYDKPPS